MRMFVTAALAAGLTVGLTAQKTTQVHGGRGGSPHVKSEWTVDGAIISIQYGRPYLKGRDIKTLEPAGEVWRIGADEATTLVTNRKMNFDTLAVPPGTYTLYAVPGDKKWELAINKQTGQWGTVNNADQDLARIDMQTSTLPTPVEQFQITVEPTSAQAGVLALQWDTTRAYVPFTVKPSSE
jgi:hypothetical protein